MSTLARISLRSADRSAPRRSRGFAQAVTEAESPGVQKILAEEKALAHHAARELLRPLIHFLSYKIILSNYSETSDLWRKIRLVHFVLREVVPVTRSPPF